MDLQARLQLFKYFRSERVAQDTENFAKKDRKVGLQVTCKWSGWQAEKAAKREAALASKFELPPVTTLKALLDESRSQREKRTRLRKEAWERSCEVHENRIMRIESDVKRKNAALDMHLRSLPVGQPSATPAQQEALRSLRRWRQRRWYWILMMWPTIAQWAVRFAFHRLQYRLTTMRKQNLARKYVALWRKRVACFKRLRLFRAFGKFGQMLARSQMLGRASGKLAKFLDELLRFLTIKDLRHAGRILISTSRFQRTYQKSKSHWRETHAKMHDQFVVLERSLCSHRYQTPECVKAVLSGSPTLSSPGRKSRARINSALNEFASADERMLGGGLTEPDENLFADGATTFREEEEVTERSDLSAPSIKVPAAASIALSRMSSKSSVGAKSAKSISRQKSSKGKGGKGKKKKKEEDSFCDLDDPADSLLLDDDTRRDLLKQLIKQRRRSYQHALMKWKAQMEAFRRECRLRESKVWSLKPLDPVSYLEPGAGMHAAVAAAEREAAFINKQSEIHGIRAVIMPAPPDHPRTYHKEEAKTILMDFYRMERRCKEQEEATGQMLVESSQTLTNLMSKRLEKQKKKKGGSKSPKRQKSKAANTAGDN
uniref:Uncharacterized protein n=1 Tax=Chromera velia CCMP2878 TaxID=1169474 RepID=A0A0G4I6C4_9ALVE|eukprot:Cvel_11293.t1-p1 / transcript=Cvel_11293.t1 / gene=Cvel_11293 / organism=Chromera_velia_CCMP2878 / gene_product=hypothetical protein / transcript_product=hypothetical protein / location=Cvel_scaffold705:31565-36906(+) / protein_length=601 / sequence_SO=supercontig / SO=protein_coding / is_pseudo=false